MERKNVLGLFIELLQILLIYFFGEILIIQDFNLTSFIPNGLLKGILFIIVIFKPVNTNFKIFFRKYSPRKVKNHEENSNWDDTIEGAGSIIGSLERLLIALLMSYGQYGAIGLVFTAKSVTRFDKISKEPSFAEYYLIGSLYSIISVLIIYGLMA